MAGTRVLKPKHILWDKDRVRFKERCFTKAVEIRYSDMIAAYMVVSDRKNRRGAQTACFGSRR